MGTPAVAYTYDGGSALPLSAGRLIQTSNGISTTNVLGYDGLGEITASQQITEGQIYNFAYPQSGGAAHVGDVSIRPRNEQ